MNLKLWFVIVICNHIGTGRDLSTARMAIAKNQKNQKTFHKPNKYAQKSKTQPIDWLRLQPQ